MQHFIICNCSWVLIQLLLSQDAVFLIKLLPRLSRNNASSTNFPTAASQNRQLLRQHELICSHAAQLADNRTSLPGPWVLIEQRDLLLVAHILFSMSKSILDSWPALSTNQTYNCSTESLIFRDVRNFFLTELLWCCHFNYVTHCMQTVTFLQGILCGFQNSWEDCYNFCSPEDQHGNYCFGLSCQFYSGWNLTDVIWLILLTKEIYFSTVFFLGHFKT